MSCTRSVVENITFRPSFIPFDTPLKEYACYKSTYYCSSPTFAINWMRYYYCWLSSSNFWMLVTLIFFFYYAVVTISYINYKFASFSTKKLAKDSKFDNAVSGLTLTLLGMALPEVLLGAITSARPFGSPGNYDYLAVGALSGSIFYTLSINLGLLIKDGLQLNVKDSLYTLIGFLVTLVVILIFSFSNFLCILFAGILIAIYGVYVLLVWLDLKDAANPQEPVLEQRLINTGGGQGGAGNGAQGGRNPPQLRDTSLEVPGDQTQEAQAANNGNTGNNRGAVAQNRDQYKSIDDFVSGLTGALKGEWARKNCLERVLFIPLVPVIILIELTIPTPVDRNYKKIFWFAHGLLSPIIAILAFTGRLDPTTSINGSNWWWLIIWLVVGILIAVVLFCISGDGKPVPVVQPLACLFMCFCWVFYILKMGFDSYFWNVYYDNNLSSTFYGSLIIGFGMAVRHHRTAKNTSGKAELVQLLFKHSHFAYTFCFIVLLLVRYFRYLDTENGVNPRFDLFDTIYRSRFEFYLIFLMLSVVYRAGDLMSMNWRNQFSLKAIHWDFILHVFVFYLILQFVLEYVNL